MSGSRIGGEKTRDKMLAQNPDYYKEMGALGGSGTRPETRYFYRNRDVARAAGAKGGTISRRPKRAA